MYRGNNKPQDTGKNLRNTIRLRRWTMIGGIAVGLQAVLNVFTRPEESVTALLFHVPLAVGCIGYSLSLTPRIRRLSQALESEK